MHTYKQMTAAAILVVAMAVQGCSGNQARSGAGSESQYVSGRNLDLLFATEFPVDSKVEALARANAAYRDGEIDKALFYSVKALSFDKSDVALLVQIAGLHEQTGDRRLAARAYHLALQQDSAYPPALQGLGLLYFESGQRDKAQHYLQLAVAGDSTLWRAFNALGVLADGRREYSLALQFYDHALALQPAAVNVRINRGWSRFLSGDLEDAARELYDVAEEMNHPKAWRNLGMVYGRLGWYEESLNVFLKVEDEAVANNRLGLIAMDNDQLDLATSYFTAALRHSPVHFAEAERNLTEVQRRQTATDRR